MGEIKVVRKKGLCQRKLLFKDFHSSLPIFRRVSHFNSILGVAEKPRHLALVGKA